MAPFTSIADSVCYPPLDGSLTFPDMVEFNATHNSTRPIYTFVDAQGELQHVSHLEFHRACQRVAHAVRPGRQGPDGTVVGIIANSDTLLYHALTIGIMNAGLIPFPMSPRNSPAAVANMMRKVGSSRLIATRHSLGTLLDSVRDEMASHGDIVIDEPPTLAYAYPKLGKESADDPFVPYPKADQRPTDDTIALYLHSSGSTGFPKPIPITHLTTVHWCITPSVLEHVSFPAEIRIGAASLPAFHALAAYVHLATAIAGLARVTLFAPTSYHDPSAAPVIPTPENTLEAAKQSNANAVVVVPAFLEEWALSSQAVEQLNKLEYVMFAGGPLSQKAGDGLVAAGVKLSSVYGGTEFGPLTCVFRSPEEYVLWEWVRFGPNQSIRWVPQGDGTYECQVLTCPTHQLSVENLPDVRGYATSDAFVKHPTIEGLYKIVGRVDDVLIHSSGEKTVPAPMETVIGSSALVSGVCMFGRGRNHTGVLVEARPAYAIDVTDEKQVAEFRNKIWPEVEEANKAAPAFSRIFKEMILVTSNEKPMVRAGKGTVTKKATLALYEAEVEALYASVETSTKAGIDIPLPATWTQTDVENWLLVHAMAIHSGKPIQVDVDVFEQGFDSLTSTFLKNRIYGSLSGSPDKAIRGAASRISSNVIFANPTLRQLASHLIQSVAGTGASPLSAPDPKTEIENMIAKYSIGFSGVVDDVLATSGEWSHHRHAVLLTGSTGGLGSYLLASLLSREHVDTVYAFNRPSKAGKTIQERQRAAFSDRGIDTALLDAHKGKLVYLEGDASQRNLSLDEKTYAELRNTVTIIIHNAWRLDFNMALSSFEGHVKGTRHLIDLAHASKVHPRFMFTSSIASAQGWDRRKGVFPEAVQTNAEVAVGPGYGASKYVSERILAMSGLPVTSFRIGQITGGVPRGAWSTTDWVPILLKSSVALGALPDAQGVASWLPPQAVSGAILDVAFADAAPPLAVNLVHPRPAPWATLMQPISEAMYETHRLTEARLPLVPLREWVAQLSARAVDASEATLRQIPAIKLLEFVRALAAGDEVTRQGAPEEDGEMEAEAAGFARFATDVAEGASETMRALAPLPGEDAKRWVDYWVSAGLFSEAA